LLGVGPITARAVVATVPDARLFRHGRFFGAWLGLTPRQHSRGGKTRLGASSKRGDADLRGLLVAHFSDRGRRFRRDRGRCFGVIVDDHGSTRVMGFMVSQSSTMTPQATIVGRVKRQACPRRRSSRATNDRRGGQAVFGGTVLTLLGLREAIMT